MKTKKVINKKATKKADGEAAVLAAIAAMPGLDRAMGEKLYTIIKASAPALSPKLWYGMPAYAKDGLVGIIIMVILKICLFLHLTEFSLQVRVNLVH
jgi:hypothetical protein